MKKKIKLNIYFFFILACTILSLSCYFVEGYKHIISKSLPSRSGILTEEIKPIWNKMMQLNQINNYITFMLGIVAFVCLLSFIYTLGTKNNSIIKKSLLLTIIYLILMIIIGAIANYTESILYGNTIFLFSRSITYIVLIIIIGTIRQIFMKLKERNIANE